MKMTVFFRSKEKSNNISSATKHQLLKSKVDKFIDVEFINLDKRNLQKYLKENHPNKVYLWHDEENVTDYITENYPSIDIVTYDSKEAVKKEKYHGYETQYILAEKIIEGIKDTTGFKEFYEVDVYKWTIKKQKMTNYDYEKISYKQNHFETIELAETYIIECLQKHIINSELSIKTHQEKIKNCKKILKKYQKKD